MNRGEIYYIAHRKTIGSEIKKARPAIIVSNDHLNATSEVVEVVYLTTQPKNEMPSHVAINSSGCDATALCEHIDHVSTLLVGDFCGVCTKEELAALDRALKWSLGMLEPATTKADIVEEAKQRAIERIHNRHIHEEIEDTEDIKEELTRIRAERDTYKAILEQALRQGVCGA